MDAELTDRERQDLEDRVRVRLAGRVRDFRLIATPAGLRLDGKAISFHSKQLAQEYVRGEGGRVAANEIQVDYPEGADDAG